MVRTTSVAVAPEGMEPVSLKPTTRGISMETGWPSIAASASMPPTPQPPVQPVQTVAPAPYPAYPPQLAPYPTTRPVPYDPNIPF